MFIVATAVAYYLTGSVDKSLSVAVIYFIGAAIVYYVYERIWDRIMWGRVSYFPSIVNGGESLDSPICLHCGNPLPREIKVTGAHHESCPWNYYIECQKCGYQNNLAKLLGFWAGCSEECRRR